MLSGNMFGCEYNKGTENLDLLRREYGWEGENTNFIGARKRTMIAKSENEIYIIVTEFALEGEKILDFLNGLKLKLTNVFNFDGGPSSGFIGHNELSQIVKMLPSSSQNPCVTLSFLQRKNNLGTFYIVSNGKMEIINPSSEAIITVPTGEKVYIQKISAANEEGNNPIAKVLYDDSFFNLAINRAEMHPQGCIQNGLQIAAWGLTEQVPYYDSISDNTTDTHIDAKKPFKIEEFYAANSEGKYKARIGLNLQSDGSWGPTKFIEVTNDIYYTTGGPLETEKKANGFIITPKYQVASKMATRSAGIPIYDKAKGSLITTVTNGETIYVDELYSEKNTDGNRWVKVHTSAKSGYTIYNPDELNLIGTPGKSALMKLVSSGAHLRQYPVDGKVYKTVTRGNTMNIKNFLVNEASDGYRWMIVESEGVRGYAQYEPEVMYPYTTLGAAPESGESGGSGEVFHMVLEGSAARIRESAVSGNVLETVAKGNELAVEDIFFEMNSDYFHWMKVHHNKSGYAQYDPTVMYPVGKPAAMCIRDRR